MISGDEPHRVTGLHAGETYFLRETAAPEGFIQAQELFFVVEDSAGVQQIVMENVKAELELVVEKEAPQQTEAGRAFPIRSQPWKTPPIRNWRNLRSQTGSPFRDGFWRSIPACSAIR